MLSASDPVQIRGMFDRISGNYDRANDLLSLGVHKLWKRALARDIALRAGERALDAATGTGDMAFLLERLAPKAEIQGVDFCNGMLDVARAKAKRSGSQVRFLSADVCALPFSAQSFDRACISFGIRNTRDPSVAIAELARVVRPGGTIHVLEFGRPQGLPSRALFRIYSSLALPTLGGALTGQRDAYRYLHGSSQEFPCGASFVKLVMNTRKFSGCRFRPLFPGMAYLYRFEVEGRGHR